MRDLISGNANVVPSTPRSSGLAAYGLVAHERDTSGGEHGGKCDLNGYDAASSHGVRSPGLPVPSTCMRSVLPALKAGAILASSATPTATAIVNARTRESGVKSIFRGRRAGKTPSTAALNRMPA